MPSVAREIQITYGGFPVGGDTDRLIDDFIQHRVGKDVASVEFSFFVQGDTSEDFASECLAAETAFRTPYQDLVVTFGGSVVLQLRQGSSSGLDAVPEIAKGEDEADSGRRRRYTVRIECGIPADTAGMAGRRESRIEVAWSASRRRTVTFSGVWTAVGSTDARSQYTSSSPAWRTAALSAIGGTYEIVEESVEPSTNDKTAAFRVVYKEILRAQSSAGTNDTGIVDPVLTIRRLRSSPGDALTEGAVRLVELECRFECSVDHDVTGDLAGKWDAIRTWIVEQIQLHLEGGAFAVTSEAPEFDEHAHKIRAVITALGADDGSGRTAESTIVVRDHHAVGKRLIPAWDGNPFARHIYPGPATITRTITRIERVLTGTIDAPSAAAGVAALAEQFMGPPHGGPNATGGGRWIQIDADSAVTPLRIGRDPWTMDVTEVTASITFEWATPVRIAAPTTGPF